MCKVTRNKQQQQKKRDKKISHIIANEIEFGQNTQDNLDPRKTTSPVETTRFKFHKRTHIHITLTPEPTHDSLPPGVTTLTTQSDPVTHE